MSDKPPKKRMYKQKFAHVKHIYYDIETGQQSTIRLTEHQTCFDSLSEFRLYKMLCQYFQPERFLILIHPELPLTHSTWKIDFSISAKDGDWTAQVILANIVNMLHSTNYTMLRRIYIEFKGFQDDNFLKHMKNVAVHKPMLGTTIILVSDMSSAFGCWDSTRKKFYTHPIIATSLLEDVLKLQEF